MKNFFKSLLIANCSLLIAPLAHAAGTYYNGNYQSPQSYQPSAGYQPSNYRPAYTQQQPVYQQANTGISQQYANQGYRPIGVAQQQSQQRAAAPQAASASGQTPRGFYIDGGISRESAMWQFDMKNAGSSLHYDNISWNVFDIKGGYVFDAGNTGLRVDAGLKIGMQAGDSSMVDDDISKGGYLVTEWVGPGPNYNHIGYQIGHALSVGTSSGGSMLGFNIGLGLTDMFQVGKTRITPSVGYRTFSYKLQTKQNYGLSVDTAACITVPGSDEEQCDPAIVIHYTNGSEQIIWGGVDANNDGFADIGTGADGVDSGGTYYYHQPGVSHSYEVSWSGPYLAVDLDYDINQYNAVKARVELGLPGYTSTGDQPYRFDWAHPKSVEDTAGMGSAMHLGLGADWKTAVSDTVMLTVGLTYDYYTVSGANAATYLNSTYWNGIYGQLLTAWTNATYPGKTANPEADMLGQTPGIAGDPTALLIKDYQAAGWTLKDDSEIESFYKSLGIRIGLTARF
ncbi:MAG: hypothetical protein LBJ18_02240 [Rickettsiales bacterium]|jgi:hypothetical protein|nr:hypothetical protein [Rickettsiales bacterium]